MDKIKILIIVISLFLLMGASCQESLKREGGGGREISYSGTDGLTVEFIEGMPPKNVWRDMTFDVGLDVQNKALLDVEKGMVCFSGMPSNLFTNSDGCQSLGDALGGRLTYPDGEIRSYFWNDYKLTPEYKSYGEDKLHPLIAKVCYESETKAGANACIKNIGRGMASLCEGGNLDLGGSSQGAPVAVTSVYEDIIPKEDGVDLRFEITISNVGDGEIIDLEELRKKDDCNFETTEKNKVSIEATLAGYSEKLDCGKINLGQRTDVTILCKGTFSVEEGESYPLPLNIKLNYGYLSTKSGGFTIKKDFEEE